MRSDDFIAYWRVHRDDGYVYPRRFASQEEAEEPVRALASQDLTARPYSLTGQLLDREVAP